MDEMVPSDMISVSDDPEEDTFLYSNAATMPYLLSNKLVFFLPVVS